MARRSLATLLLLSLCAFGASAAEDAVTRILDRIPGEWDWVETRILAFKGEIISTPETEGYTERVIFEVLNSRGGNGRLLRNGNVEAEQSFEFQNSVQPGVEEWVWMQWGELGDWWVQINANLLILHADNAAGPRMTYERQTVGTEPRSFGQIKSSYQQP